MGDSRSVFAATADANEVGFRGFQGFKNLSLWPENMNVWFGIGTSILVSVVGILLGHALTRHSRNQDVIEERIRELENRVISIEAQVGNGSSACRR